MINPKISLTGQFVRLEPLELIHADELLQVGQHATDWDFLPRGCFTDLQDVQNWIISAHRLIETDRQIPFCLIDQKTNQVVGSTRYLDLRIRDHVVEIGYTWLAPAAQRTAINTEAKFLLMQYAFEQMNMRRVELKTDLRNVRSQNAITRIGATREGVLRKHKCVQNDFQRDTVYFSVIDEEWVDVKARLLERLGLVN
ncbi:MAG: GNAT family N-acetyltransferase [Gammaproteobacteria bacterium]|nr:GNAT family N-acetyltransferase [Gammaproteobacteria bacterium]